MSKSATCTAIVQDGNICLIIDRSDKGFEAFNRAAGRLVYYGCFKWRGSVPGGRRAIILSRAFDHAEQKEFLQDIVETVEIRAAGSTEGRCCRCGRQENVSLAPDPVCEKVFDDHAAVWECDACRMSGEMRPLPWLPDKEQDKEVH